MVSRKKTRGTATDNIVNMSGIFKPHEECPQPRTVLIEGKPGMGKTTYCKKMVYDWAKGKQEAEDSFPQFETVLLLKCRDMKSNLWEAIDDQLLPRDVKEDVRERFFNFIRQNQSNVSLVLDGLDEVPTRKLPMFTEIIQGRRELPKCRVVATARHEAGIKLRIHCDTLLQIEGFTEEDAREFIFKYFKGNKNLAEKLLSKLENDENLRDMAVNPLNTVLLCLICEELEGIFPKSKTQLYVEIIQCILRRYRNKKGLPETNEDLVKVYDAQLKHLGRIALKGLLDDYLDFEESELESHADELPGFGFLSVQTGGSKLRPCRHYSFLHKSFQECFAALYLCSQLLIKEISVDELAADRRYLEELKEVLSFTCGMVAAHCEETAEALIKSITVQVNDAGCFHALLGSISECRREDTNFHLKMARVSGSFLKLQSLELYNDTDVGLLAEALTVNSALTELSLRYNSIGDQGATGLAEALKVNATLKELNLDHNCIGYQGATGLAEALKVNATLTELNLNDNGIGDQGATGLAEALKINATLTELNLNDNGIGYQGATGLAEALKVNATLTELNLRYNNIGDQGATGLAEALKVNSTLTELNLCANDIREKGATGLAEALKENSTLTELNLRANGIGDQGATGLAEALKENSTLTELNLLANGIGDQGATDLAEALKENSTLIELNLRANGIGDQGATGLAEALKENSTLTELNLHVNDIGHQGAAGLAEALKENSSLTELNLCVNGIGDQGATGLAEALTKNSTLTELNLSANGIGDQGATGLAEALKVNSRLTGLALDVNCIGDQGATSLAEALKENSTLTELNLHVNDIGHQGAAGLAEALKENSSLTELNLCVNGIGDQGATGLAEALTKNSTLTELNLAANGIGDQGATGLAEALKVNSRLTGLALDVNCIGDQGATSLAEALKENSTLTDLRLNDNNIGEMVLSELRLLQHDSCVIFLSEQLSFDEDLPELDEPCSDSDFDCK